LHVCVPREGRELRKRTAGWACSGPRFTLLLRTSLPTLPCARSPPACPARIDQKRDCSRKRSVGQRGRKRLHSTVGPLAFFPISGSQAQHDSKEISTRSSCRCRERGSLKKATRAWKKENSKNRWNEYPRHSLLPMIFTSIGTSILLDDAPIHHEPLDLLSLELVVAAQITFFGLFADVIETDH